MRLMKQRGPQVAPDPAGRRPGQRNGQAMVEFVLMLPLLLMLAVGILEFGMLFKDYVGIHYASREGGRAGAAASRNPDADCTILRAVSTTMQTMPYNDLVRVRIFKANSTGGCDTGCAENIYIRPGGPGRVCLPSEWVDYSINWIPDAIPGRDNVPPTDAIAVSVQFTHKFFFNYVPGASNSFIIEDTSYNQIEPELLRPTHH